MIKSRWFFVLLCVFALSAGIFACGSSDDSGAPCFITATTDMFWGSWLISPGSLDEVASYVSFDGMGNITAHGFMYDPDFGTVTPTGCGNFSMTIQNTTADAMVIKGTLTNGDMGTITSIGGMATSAAFSRQTNIPSTGIPAWGTLTETCSSSPTYSELCNGTSYNYSLSIPSFGDSPSGSVTGKGETFTVDAVDSIALWADSTYFFFLRTDAAIVNTALESYGMIRFSVDDTTKIGKFNIDADIVDPVAGIANKN